MSGRLQRILSQTKIIGKEILDTVPIVECNEPLVDLATAVPNIIIRMTESRREYAQADELYARKTVCAMLARAAQVLFPHYYLVAFDAYRPIEYQRVRYQQVYQAIKQRHSSEPEDIVQRLVYEVIFPPDEDPQHPSPHTTGGAVDVTIATSDGILVDLGSTYDVYDETERTRHLTNAPCITEVQRANRMTLLRAMVESGFCNYPGEWWHYMYGDREYAAYESLPHAIYGRADLLS
jgi:D-alanyl-D-alanine dipeptidase